MGSIVEAMTTVTAVARASRTLTLQDLGNGKVLVYPLNVVSEQLGVAWTVFSPDLDLLGEGESEFEALDELREKVGQLYEELSLMREELGEHLLHKLAFLDRLAGSR